MISVGMEFVSGLAWWFWLRVFHEIQLNVDRGCSYLKACLGLEGFLAKQPTWLQVGAGYGQDTPNPLQDSLFTGLFEYPQLWKLATPKLNDPRNQGRNCVFYALDSEVTHYRFHCIFIFLFIFLKIYLFLAALGLCCCARAFSNCGEQGLLFAVVRELLIVVASLVAEHGLKACGLQ